VIGLKLVTPPAVEPVTLAQAKQHLVVDTGFTSDDALITALITAARQHLEDYTHRAFFAQTWLLTVDNFPMRIPFDGTLRAGSSGKHFLYSSIWKGTEIALPKPACIWVESITYVDQTGTPQTLASNQYYVDPNSEPARIVPMPGMWWPYIQNYLPGSVQVTFQCGSYGDGVEVNTCPQTVVSAILMLVAHLYQNREATSEVALQTVPFGVYALVAGEKFDAFTFGAFNDD
jgi:uncharacterized phiE125 gp8 family phage protein